jgi:hypothetical protein
MLGITGTEAQATEEEGLKVDLSLERTVMPQFPMVLRMLPRREIVAGDRSVACGCGPVWMVERHQSPCS